MDLKKKVTISWSGGKDSALSLLKILQSGEFEIVHLHTVINEETRRVGLHGVHETLIQAQADAMGLKLVKLYLPSSEDHTAYEKLMLSFYSQCAAEQIDAVVFGDIFLEDLKNYREKMLQVSGVKGIFPLWRMKSKDSKPFYVPRTRNIFSHRILVLLLRVNSSIHFQKTLTQPGRMVSFIRSCMMVRFLKNL
jgi:hypothetical protein